MRAREGFSLVEVIVSLTLLSVVIMALSGTAAQYAHNVSISGARAAAMQMANDRIDEIQMHPRYGEIATVFSGSELDVYGVRDALRRTTVRRQADTLSTGVVDMTKVTVEVEYPGLLQPISRTMIVAAP